MKQMTKLENIIMNRSGCNRETANLIANDILQEVEKDLQAEVAREIFEEIENLYMEEHNGCAVHMSRYEFAELKKKYVEGEE